MSSSLLCHDRKYPRRVRVLHLLEYLHARLDCLFSSGLRVVLSTSFIFYQVVFSSFCLTGCFWWEFSPTVLSAWFCLAGSLLFSSSSVAVASDNSSLQKNFHLAFFFHSVANFPFFTTSLTYSLQQCCLNLPLCFYFLSISLFLLSFFCFASCFIPTSP